jgi:hypothetical protein
MPATEADGNELPRLLDELEIAWVENWADAVLLRCRLNRRGSG